MGVKMKTHTLEIGKNGFGHNLAYLKPNNSEDIGSFRISGPKPDGGFNLYATYEISGIDLVRYIKSYAPDVLEALQEERKDPGLITVISGTDVNQNTCTHPIDKLVKNYSSNTGNYDPSSDIYFVNVKCTVCNERWSASTSASKVNVDPEYSKLSRLECKQTNTIKG